MFNIKTNRKNNEYSYSLNITAYFLDTLMTVTFRFEIGLLRLQNYRGQIVYLDT
jgi:hypothetical protein